VIFRPQRYRTIKGFVMGLSLSLILLVAGYFWHLNRVKDISETEIAEIKNKAIEDYIQKNPKESFYVFASTKMAGEVITETDLSEAEISPDFLPSDAVTKYEDALGKVLRCDVTANTAVTLSLLYEKGDYSNDLRLTEYSVIQIPQKLEPRQFIDVRIMFPNGLDYIVLSKKQVLDLNRDFEKQKNMLWFHSGEEEILRMASAIVDASLVEGAYLFALPYIAPDIQDEAIKTYPANLDVQNLIHNNPNIIQQAVTELEKRNRILFEDRINQAMQNKNNNRVYDSKPETALTHKTTAANNQDPGEFLDERLREGE